MTKKQTKELVNRFWSVHHSHCLSKQSWALKESVDALLPEIIVEVQKAQKEEILEKIKVIQAGNTEDNMILLEARLAKNEVCEEIINKLKNDISK